VCACRLFKLFIHPLTYLPPLYSPYCTRPVYTCGGINVQLWSVQKIEIHDFNRVVKPNPHYTEARYSEGPVYFKIVKDIVIVVLLLLVVVVIVVL